MNAAVRAAVRTALTGGVAVAGIMRGYQGLLEADIRPLDWRSVGDIVQRAGTVLRSARSTEFKTEEGVRRGARVLAEAGVDGVVVIGGDGSFRGANELARLGVMVAGVPASIDNDMACTDISIGFDTAVNTALDAINKIRDTASSHGRVNVIEVMGRTSGFLAVAAGLAGGADAILVPEVEADLDRLGDQILKAYARGKTHYIVVVAEGFGGHRPWDASTVPEGGVFGASSGFEVGRLIRERTSVETRVTVLGHIQRGGAPTALDRILAARLAARAVELLLAGESGKVVGLVGGKVVATDIEDAVRRKKAFDRCDYDLAATLS